MVGCGRRVTVVVARLIDCFSRSHLRLDGLGDRARVPIGNFELTAVGEVERYEDDGQVESDLADVAAEDAATLDVPAGALDVPEDAFDAIAELPVSLAPFRGSVGQLSAKRNILNLAGDGHGVLRSTDGRLRRIRQGEERGPSGVVSLRKLGLARAASVFADWTLDAHVA